MLAVALLGIVGGTGLVLYLVARRLLDYTVFGLLVAIAVAVPRRETRGNRHRRLRTYRSRWSCSQLRQSLHCGTVVGTEAATKATWRQSEYAIELAMHGGGTGAR
jgi:hypothetical protein